MAEAPELLNPIRRTARDSPSASGPPSVRNMSAIDGIEPLGSSSEILSMRCMGKNTVGKPTRSPSGCNTCRTKSSNEFKSMPRIVMPAGCRPVARPTLFRGASAGSQPQFDSAPRKHPSASHASAIKRSRVHPRLCVLLRGVKRCLQKMPLVQIGSFSGRSEFAEPVR
jgi:hypothetical protein